MAANFFRRRPRAIRAICKQMEFRTCASNRFLAALVALVGLSLAGVGCNQSSPATEPSTAQADSSRPRPLKYEVKVDAQSDAPPQDAPVGDDR